MMTENKQPRHPLNSLTGLEIMQNVKPNTAHKKCCGGCTGKGSCENMTKVSFIPETSKDIAPLK